MEWRGKKSEKKIMNEEWMRRREKCKTKKLYDEGSEKKKKHDWN